MRVLLILLLASTPALAQQDALEGILHKQHIHVLDPKEPWRSPHGQPAAPPESPTDAAQKAKGCIKDSTQFTTNPDGSIAAIWTCPPSK